MATCSKDGHAPRVECGHGKGWTNNIFNQENIPSVGGGMPYKLCQCGSSYSCLLHQLSQSLWYKSEDHFAKAYIICKASISPQILPIIPALLFLDFFRLPQNYACIICVLSFQIQFPYSNACQLVLLNNSQTPRPRDLRHLETRRPEAVVT